MRSLGGASAPPVRRLLLIDPRAEDRGHLLDDDLFLARSLRPYVDELECRSSPESLRRIRKAGLGARTRVVFPRGRWTRRMPRLTMMLRMALAWPGRYDTVLVQSFCSGSMLLYALLHPRKRIFVIVTGDVKWLGGSDSRAMLERWKYRQILRRVSAVVTHTRFEAQLVGGLVAAGERSRVRIVPFHQIGEHRWVRPSGQRHGRISFIGGGRRDKGLERFVEMIAHDTTGKHEYGLYGNLHLDARTRAILANAPANVEVVDRYISDSEYWERMRESSFVILPHRRSFEGALSGIFCDAIASGTPIIASRMEPYIEFFERFGEMGYLVDYERPAWYRDILKRDLYEKYELFQSNMRRARDWHSHDRIRARFAEILFGERTASPEAR